MASQDLGNLMGSTAFAKLCGVTVQTVMNWVQSGKVIPAHQVGKTCYFSEDNFIQVQVDKLRSSALKSFLGVVVGETETDADTAETSFVKAVRDVLPKAHMIKSVRESLSDMMNKDNGGLSDETLLVFKSRVCEALVKSVRTSVVTHVSELYLAVDKADCLPLKFFLDIAFGDEPDADMLATYKGFGVTQQEFTTVGFKTAVQTSFQSLCRKFGVYASMLQLGVSVKDVYYGNVDILLQKGDFLYDKSCTRSHQIFDAFTNSVSSEAVRSSFDIICSEGYFSIVKGVGSLDDEKKAFVMKAIMNGEYSIVYLSSRNAVDSALMTAIESVSKGGKFELIIADEITQ